jgi:putative ABC transport system permease protein
VVYAAVVAMPLSWYFMHRWLQNYAYRTELSWWIFAAAGMATLLVSGLQSATILAKHHSPILWMY